MYYECMVTFVRCMVLKKKNLTIIYISQEQVEESKKKYEHMEKDRAEVMAENKRLLEPLREAKEQVDHLKKQLANYEKDKETLRVRFPV